MTTEQSQEQDWQTTAVDFVIDKVDMVKRVATNNAVLALRILVFGMVAAVMAIAALVLFIVIAVRMADAYLPIGAGVGDASWAAHLFIGSLFSILGLGAWMSRKKSSRPLLIAAVIDLAIVIVIVCYGLFS